MKQGMCIFCAQKKEAQTVDFQPFGLLLCGAGGKPTLCHKVLIINSLGKNFELVVQKVVQNFQHFASFSLFTVLTLPLEKNRVAPAKKW
jgi:hypothetical protein